METFPIDNVIIYKNEILCLKFSCGNCDRYLFNSCDIIFQSQLCNNIYLFTEKQTVSDSIKISGTNTVQCKNCRKGLGGMVYRDWSTRNHLVRFTKNMLRNYPIQLWKEY